MNYIKKGLLRGLGGILVGVFINSTILFIIALSVGVDEFPNYITNFTTQYIVSVIVGFTFAAISIIFEIDEWSITKQTVVHFIIATSVYLPSSIKAKWMNLDLASIIIFISIFLLVYVGAWVGNYFYWKNKVRDINKYLDKKHR